MSLCCVVSWTDHLAVIDALHLVLDSSDWRIPRPLGVRPVPAAEPFHVRPVTNLHVRAARALGLLRPAGRRHHHAPAQHRRRSSFTHGHVRLRPPFGSAAAAHRRPGHSRHSGRLCLLAGLLGPQLGSVHANWKPPNDAGKDLHVLLNL